MDRETKDNGEKKKTFFAAPIFIVVCIIIGFFGGTLFGKLTEGSNFEAVDIVVLLIIALVSFYATIIIHECGHLVMGMCTGYKFVSFRVGSLMIADENGRLVRKKFSIPGTAGQCIMTHDLVRDPSEIKFFWYHFGGVFFNIITALLFGSAAAFMGEGLLRMIFIVFASISLIQGILNIIPMNASVPNDGMNILVQYKSPEKRVVMANILAANGLMHKGISPADLPDEYLITADENGDSPFCDLCILKAMNLMYKHDHEAAERMFTSLSENSKMAEIQRNECRCDLLYCMIMLQRDKAEIEKLYSEMKNYIKQMEKYAVGRHRLMYAYYKLVQNDDQKAQAELAAAEKMADTYPLRSEFEEEMKLIKYIDAVSKHGVTE